MSASVRVYLAVVVVGVCMMGLAIGVLMGSRLVGPNAPLVRRGLLPRPWRRLTAWARCRSLRIWCPESTFADEIRKHVEGEAGRSFTDAGVSLVSVPAMADVVVGTAGVGMSDDDRAGLCPPWSSIGLVDPSDGDEFARAIDELAARHRSDVDRSVDGE